MEQERTEIAVETCGANNATCPSDFLLGFGQLFHAQFHNGRAGILEHVASLLIS